MVELNEHRTLATIDPWIPMVWIFRDLWYGGSWEAFSQDFCDHDRIEQLIQQCRQLEEESGGSLQANFLLPTCTEELRSFQKEMGFSIQQMRHTEMTPFLDMIFEYFDREEWEEVINLVDMALEADPRSVRALEIKGSVLVEKGLLVEGISYLNQAITIDPYLTEAYYTLGQTYFNLGDYEKAIHHWKKVIQYQPDDPFVTFFLVDAYLNIHQRSKAKELLSSYISRNPSNIYGLYHLYKLSDEDGDEEMTKNLKESILGIIPRNLSELEVWARFQLENGQYDKVLEEVRRFQELEPDNDYLRLLMAIPLAKAGEFARVLEIVALLKKNRYWYRYGKHEFFYAFLTPEERERCGV